MIRPVLAVLLLGLLAVPGVLAHAEPLQSEPAPGQRLDASPHEAVVSFTERIYEEGSWIRVYSAAGERVDLDDLRATSGDHPVLRVGLPELADGAYVIRWQTYSQTDGHTVGGQIGFAVGGFAPPSSSTSDEGVPVLAALSRALSYLGYAAGIGALAFRFRVLKARPVDALLDRFLLAGAALHVLGSGALILDTAASTGLGLAPYLASDGGQAFLIRFLVAVALLVLTALWTLGPVRPKAAPGLLAVGWIVAVATGSRFGHANQGHPLAWIVEALHAVAIAAWVGGLCLLLVHLVRLQRAGADDRTAEAQRLGRNFADLAIGAVALVAVTGLALSILILGVRDLFDARLWAENAWRAFLSAKVGLVVAMVGLAGVNRYVFLATDDETGPWRVRLRAWADHRLRWQSITQSGGVHDFRNVAAVEAAFGVATLVLAGFLMSVAAPTLALEAEGSVFEATAQGTDFIGLLRIAPEPVAGDFTQVRIFLQSLDQEPETTNTCGTDACMRIHWWLDDELQAQQATGVPEGDGWWTFPDVLFTGAGNTTLELRATSAYVFEDDLVFTVPVLSRA